MEKILVTGGAGFIGSNFIRLMFEKYPKIKIINLDKLTYAGNLNNLKDLEKNNNYTFVKGDICNKNIVNKLTRNVDTVVNFAAETHVDRSITDADSFIQTNVFGTYVLLQASKQNKTKFMQISTDEVYGSIENGPFKETDKLNPNSPYSASKASADMIVRSFHETYDLFTLITRSSNNFGSYQHPEKLIPLFITNLIEEKKIPLYGDGLNVRDWIYVTDNCNAIDFILQNGEDGEIYNIASGIEKRNIEITKKILELLDMDESYIKYVEDRLGHDRKYSLNTNEINKLGWKPGIDFDQAMKMTVEWYKNNEWWWKPLK